LIYQFQTWKDGTLQIDMDISFKTLDATNDFIATEIEFNENQSASTQTKDEFMKWCNGSGFPQITDTGTKEMCVPAGTFSTKYRAADYTIMGDLFKVISYIADIDGISTMVKYESQNTVKPDRSTTELKQIIN